jgi:hypothetical protein
MWKLLGINVGFNIQLQEFHKINKENKGSEFRV